MLAPRFGALTVVVPDVASQLELVGHDAEQGRVEFHVSSERDARIAHVAKLYGEAQPICRASMLSNAGQVGIAEGVKPDQLIFGVRQGQQAVALGGA